MNNQLYIPPDTRLRGNFNRGDIQPSAEGQVFPERNPEPEPSNFLDLINNTTNNQQTICVPNRPVQPRPKKQIKLVDKCGKPIPAPTFQLLSKKKEVKDDCGEIIPVPPTPPSPNISVNLPVIIPPVENEWHDYSFVLENVEGDVFCACAVFNGTYNVTSEDGVTWGPTPVTWECMGSGAGSWTLAFDPVHPAWDNAIVLRFEDDDPFWEGTGYWLEAAANIDAWDEESPIQLTVTTGGPMANSCSWPQFITLEPT